MGSEIKLIYHLLEDLKKGVVNERVNSFNNSSYNL